MRVERREGYRVVVGGPVPPQADAITLRRTIIVRERAADDSRLLDHELVHVRQFRDLGVPRFLVRYVGSYLRLRLGGYGHLAAYRRIPLEVEACWASRPRTDAVAASNPTGQLEVEVPRPAPVGGSGNRPRRSSGPMLRPVLRPMLKPALRSGLQAASPVWRTRA